MREHEHAAEGSGPASSAMRDQGILSSAMRDQGILPWRDAAPEAIPPLWNRTFDDRVQLLT